MENKTQFTKDLPNKRIVVERTFDAPLTDVWRAWTENELLDQWWAPRPWHTETKSLTFKEGGYWLYVMAGPNGERHWCKIDFITIDNLKSFEVYNYFCDENGEKNTAFPTMTWKNSFTETAAGTKVLVDIRFSNEKDLATIVEMGFEAGFTAALGNLDQFIEAQFKLRKDMKTSSKARVTTYLNFPGNTEEALNFYKSVFKTEFIGGGIKRFGEIPEQAGHPPIAESVKKMVLHAQLPTLGGHVLMATDAPKEMGFTLTNGNNMHICLEPETREETKRIFDELSAGGTVTMPLQDMFFGSYFGEFTDKYGINWMVNHINS
ncbi:SRPBCC domain-containing protein [Ferruginibacter albus]|uniref:SRPBCC domain-containing protein n=1 Tax=Ferruginibacter albus TaxID=2875540 RepID=UPI001CC445F3|nr:SRPBCC domain-containing protein [Ferruginibacter albus]UAY53293.1 SRPBCC domain-containing protein [Ferruginibacter albus]